MKSCTLRSNLCAFLCQIGLTIAFLLMTASMLWAAPFISPAGGPLADLPTASSNIVAAAEAVTTTVVTTAARPGAGATPVRLQIPTLMLDTVIEAVGHDKNGAMGIPGQVNNVAWYAPGYLPGEWGNAVIAGHLDLANGAPAVFWSIGKLGVGDPIIVTAADGTQYHFAVTSQATYPYDQAPIDEIFGFSLRSQLNLITCKGEWNRGTRNYSNRLVISSELVETMPGRGRAWTWETPHPPPLPYVLSPSLPRPSPRNQTD